MSTTERPRATAGPTAGPPAVEGENREAPSGSGGWQLPSAPAARPQVSAAPPLRQRGTLQRWLLAAAASAVLLAAAGLLLNRPSGTQQPLIYFETARGDLPITVIERGNLESQDTVDIFCEVENLGGDRSGSTGTQVLFIIPNGASVKEGDLLVELDSGPLKERLDTQVLALEKAKAEEIQAQVKYENQITQNETSLADAELKVKLAELELQNYEDEDGGTFQIELQEVDLAIQQAQASRLIQETNLEGIRELYKLGYRSAGDLAAERLKFMGSDRELAKSISTRKELVEYRYQMRILELQGALDSARRSRTQVGRDNESLLAQTKAAKDAAEKAREKEEERYERYQSQLEKCKIHAPVSGMVTYAQPSRYNRTAAVEEGAFVRQRQKLLSLPSLTKMQVKTAIHESVLDRVKPGQQTTIRIDAFPDRQYRGSVKTVAVMPDQGGWLSSDTKVYTTLVTIDEDVSQLKPGMTAVVEIHVENRQDIISVPVQAIVQIAGDNWCYVDEGGRVTRRMLELGSTNDKFVEIQQGLDVGEQVVLNPKAIMDESRDPEAAPQNTAEEPLQPDSAETPDQDEP